MPAAGTLAGLKRDVMLRVAALLPGPVLARLQGSCRQFDAVFVREAVALAAVQIKRKVPEALTEGTWAQWHDSGALFRSPRVPSRLPSSLASSARLSEPERVLCCRRLCVEDGHPVRRRDIWQDIALAHVCRRMSGASSRPKECTPSHRSEPPLDRSQCCSNPCRIPTHARWPRAACFVTVTAGALRRGR